jgi:hypothetical protein
VDTTFRPAIGDPAYRPGLGPTIWIDQAHHNIVTADRNSRYGPFIEVLRDDGYVIRPWTASFSAASLESIRLLVIGNALNVRNIDDWSLPTPSAFTEDEIRAVQAWVRAGGRLLLLFDHMPFAGAVADLGTAFGLEILNGLVEDPNTWDPAVFTRGDRTLAAHVVTGDAPGYARVDGAATFDGAAFRAPAATPILTLGSQYVSYQTTVAWRVEDAMRVPAGGWLQAAVVELGRGWVAVFSDATMFSAQIAPDGSRLGMNTPVGRSNLHLLRNTIRWLAQ